MNADLLEACSNLASSLAPFYDLISIGTKVAGFIIIGFSLLGLRRRGEDHRSLAPMLAGILIGTLLMAFMPFIDMVSLSVFRASAPSDFSSVQVGAGELAPMVRLAVIIVMCVGFWQVARGLVLIRQSAEMGGRFWPGVTHIFGGVLCINIQTFMQVLANTMGGSLQEVLQVMLGAGWN